MANEQYTEHITLLEMKCTVGKNSFGFVYPQGDVSDIAKIDYLLKKAGGKPKKCDIAEYPAAVSGKAKPEFIITFDEDPNTIIVVECKKLPKNHASANLDCPKNYAVDGVLYYAKFLKEEYNVIALAVSGTKKENLKTTAYYWQKGQSSYSDIFTKIKDIVLEPKSYLGIIKGEKLKKSYSLDEIRETAISMHNALREIKVTEADKPIFIAGMLIALNDDDFVKSYPLLPSYKSVISNLQASIGNVLAKSDVKNDRSEYIKSVFQRLSGNSKFASVPLGHNHSITWYIEQLELKIKPMMDYADSTLDALGIFYHEFIKYSGGDGKGLGIVLTPQHITEFMCEITDVNKNSRVADICCGTGSFLVTAMSNMFKDASPQEIERIRQHGLYGVEFDDGIYTLSITNMIIRKDGKSNIYKGDCFNDKLTGFLKQANINVGLINPPYSQTDKEELEFVEHLLDILSTGGLCAAIVPMSCATGAKFKETRERLFRKHTLKAVFSMPDDLFYPTSVNTCVMLWEAHKPHDSSRNTFFGYYKNDGFVKRKQFGRIDFYKKWQIIKEKWISLYRNMTVQEGITSLRPVSYYDEWLCEAYMATDYSKLTPADFEKTLRDYSSYMVKAGIFKHPSANHKNSNVFSEKSVAALDISKWKTFKLGTLIENIYKAKAYNKEELEAAEYGMPAIPYITRTEEDNGCELFAKAVKYKGEEEGNAITIGDTTATVFYQPVPFIAGDHIVVLRSKWFNVRRCLFLCTLMRNERYRYSYGRAFIMGKIKDTLIKLPALENGEPDWQFMEDYIDYLNSSKVITGKLKKSMQSLDFCL